jgi:hypothetical protein
MSISSGFTQFIVYSILLAATPVFAQDSTDPSYNGLFNEHGTAGGRSTVPTANTAVGNPGGTAGGGTNAGPGSFVTPSPPSRQLIDPSHVSATVTRFQSREILSSGRYVTGRAFQPAAPGSPDVVEWITYRNVVRIAAVAGNGDDNDQLLLELGGEYQEMVVPTVVNNHHFARAIQRTNLIRQISDLEAAVQIADQNLYTCSHGYYTTPDPALQAKYSSLYYAWEAHKTLVNQQLNNLKSQLSIIQE